MGSLAAHAATYLIERRRRGEMTRESAIRASYILRSLDNSFGARPLNQFGSRAIERWLEQHPNWKAGTRHTYLGQVRVFANWLRRRRLIERDAFEEISMPRRPRPSPRPLPRDDIYRILSVAPNTRARLIITLQWSLGLRCLGVANLRVEDVDYIGKAITVREKYGNERRLPLTQEVSDALRAYLDEHPTSSGPLVRSLRHSWAGISASYVSWLVAGWMQTAGVKARPFDGRGAHALRHTCLTEVAEANGDPFVLAELAGWADISTAANYVRRASVERVRNALGQRSPL